MAARLELTIRRGVTLFQSDHIWSSDLRLTDRNCFTGQIRSLLAQSKGCRYFGLQRALILRRED
jgi:hypothetical protein